MTNKLLWDVTSRTTNEELRIKLVEKILNNMTPEQLRSALHQYIYLEYEGFSIDELQITAKRKGIDLNNND